MADLNTKKLLILCQIGSPEEPTPQAVGVYLKKFLMDEKVITLPKILRWLLVNVLIVPRRKISSAEKYHKIWTKQGSPLKHETEKFTEKLKNELGPEWSVALVFAYGKLSPEQSLQTLSENKYSEVLIAPLFPQYAEATTGSVFQELVPLARKIFPQSPLKKLKPFYSQPEWSEAWIEKLQMSLKGKAEAKTHVLFSYHGLPESQIRKNPGCEINDQCCRQSDISKCYLAQCRKSTELIAQRLRLQNYSMSFQSRLGSARWLGPATENEAQRLALSGQKSLTVICPAFVADGLETLEEIGIELREKFLANGGEKFELVSSLNDDSLWVSGFAALLRRAKSWQQVDFTST